MCKLLYKNNIIKDATIVNTVHICTAPASGGGGVAGTPAWCSDTRCRINEAVVLNS